jgi:p-aminobenzoyl-glutamate transporter AbgT
MFLILFFVVSSLVWGGGPRLCHRRWGFPSRLSKPVANIGAKIVIVTFCRLCLSQFNTLILTVNGS